MIAQLERCSMRGLAPTAGVFGRSAIARPAWHGPEAPRRIVEDFTPARLTPTQLFVQLPLLRRLADTPVYWRPIDPACIYWTDGQCETEWVIADGHHRLAAAVLRGEALPVVLFRLDRWGAFMDVPV